MKKYHITVNLTREIENEDGHIQEFTISRDIPYYDIDAPHYFNEYGYLNKDMIEEFEEMLVDMGYLKDFEVEN